MYGAHGVALDATFSEAGIAQTPSDRAMANAVRFLAADAVERAQSGHPGMPLGMADVATVLFTRFLKFDAATPDWPDRDRFVLSAGHGSALLYALLHLTGYDGMTIEDLKNFRQLGSITPGHPEYGHTPGVETTTGPLGQGLANAVGMALAERVLAERFGDQVVDHRTYVIAGDGCLMEGISHEAISLAGHLRLGKLIVLFDDNGISIDGPTALAVSDDQSMRFEASGWDVQRVDGHDPDAVADAIAAAQRTGTPSLIACRTTIGYGAPTKQGTADCHGAPLGASELNEMRSALGWLFAPFHVPDKVLQAWRDAGARGSTARERWEKQIQFLSAAERRDYQRLNSGELPEGWAAGLRDLRNAFTADKPKIATRVASQQALETIIAAVPEVVGGSADLTGSNGTRPPTVTPIGHDDFAGRYIHYGVREHAMAAAMNGMALHGGVIPYGGTFLAFADYCRPAIRLSALMEQRVVYVFTHDSIGLGEDGPTHQPVEHLASLRAIPNLHVFRPCDAVETAECWELALKAKQTPSALALSRQSLPVIRGQEGCRNRCADGGYVLTEPDGRRDVTLLASGSEVHLALQAAEILAATGVAAAAVVSIPCHELFDQQDPAYQRAVLGAAPRIAIEAGVAQGWERYIGPEGAFVGMSGFGASAPASDLYRHFGLTSEEVVRQARALLGDTRA